MTDSHKEWIASITKAYRHDIFDELNKLGYAVMTEENRAASAQNLVMLEAENASLRTELAAAMTEIASQNMTIKTLSEHIANSITDGEEWLNSYISTCEEE